MTITPDLVEEWMSQRDVSFLRTGPRAWAVRLRGTVKQDLTVLLALGEQALRAEAFFMRCPQENHADVWSILLRQNFRAPVCFAIDEQGDAYVVGRVPASSLSAEEIDRLLGAILTVVEDVFMPAVERGFASYLERDLAWRKRQADASS